MPAIGRTHVERVLLDDGVDNDGDEDVEEDGEDVLRAVQVRDDAAADAADAALHQAAAR